MKQIVIGIDGGDERILNYFDMPYFKSLREKSKSFEMKEDRWSRGWVEMYTGMHARETNAFYEMPMMDGTMRFTRKYSWRDAEENSNVKFLWGQLDGAGVRSVFMNIPTTFPAPQMKNGAFVAGAGGGLNNFSTIPEGLCSDADTEKLLTELGYVVDLRYKSSGITELEKLFEKLDEMMLKRAECFVKTCKHQNADFGFLAFRATTIVQYVAMSEIEMLCGKQNYTDLIANPEEKERPIHAMLKKHYKNLDKALEIIFTSLDPEHYVLTADHGCVPFLKKVNINKLLEFEGFQTTNQAGKKVKDLLCKILPKKQFQALKSITPKKAQSLAQGYAPSKTKAFGSANVHGIYINDARRFNGVVEDGEELERTVRDICEFINTNEVAQSNHITARPYRNNYPDAFYNDCLPDIWIDMPESYFPEIGPEFVSVNEQYAPILNLYDVPTDVNSGQKGSNPLFIVDKATALNFEKLNDRELTVTYDLIKKVFNL